MNKKIFDNKAVKLEIATTCKSNSKLAKLLRYHTFGKKIPKYQHTQTQFLKIVISKEHNYNSLFY